MLDFLTISTRSPKRGVTEIYPKFVACRTTDLMIRGSDFYAIWNDETGLWSTDESVALYLIDKELDAYADAHKGDYTDTVRVLHMWDTENCMVDKWHKYCQKQMWDSYHALDEQLIFSNTVTSKTNFASKKLNYPLAPGSTDAYDELMSTLYSEDERAKIEWAIGCIVSGESKNIQKFLVLYGSAGTGKSTVINIIQELFPGYFCVFDAKALGVSNNTFALEPFRNNPLVAIQHDGDLSHIEDNTRLNSLVSHEVMNVNEKFKSSYSNRFNSFLIMGTNRPVRITDAKSGIIRRLIDVSPTGKKIPFERYLVLMDQIKFELGAIASHCLEVYDENKNAYDTYIPTAMLGASNDFYNFILDNYDIFKQNDGTTLKAAWELYKTYCDDAKVPYPYSQRNFKEELKNYFDHFEERAVTDNDIRVRNYYSGFITKKFEQTPIEVPKVRKHDILFKEQESLLDEFLENCPAQYATDAGTPIRKWDNVKTTLKDIDTSKLHYVKVPENLVVIDFDIKDKDGNKDYEANLKAASKWPKTYAELSKSGAGIHLHYIYEGDVTKLSRLYETDIEVKVYTGNSSLRRLLTKCNDIPIATINSGLKEKEGDKTISAEQIKSEKGLRKLILRNMNKEIHPATKPSVDFIHKILEDAYAKGKEFHYDVSDMRPAIMSFALKSTNNSEYCLKLVNKMHFHSEDVSEPVTVAKDELIFYDVEVFPNLFVVVYKSAGRPCVKLINPSHEEIEQLMQYKLVGFNCRRYDNHIMYARMMGYSLLQLFELSQRIINGSPNCFFGEAYNISYTDVYDFCSKKQSLKKWEIELGIHHDELGLPWNEPVPQELWGKVADYCCHDVEATEAVWNERQADFVAREILAELAGLTVNDTTNSLTTRIIFGNNRRPQDKFQYRDMGDVSQIKQNWIDDFGGYEPDEYSAFTEDGKPIFPGYSYVNGVSTYRGEEVGEGGYVYAVPGMYGYSITLDVASMHPSSVIAENLFGDEYTKTFKNLLDARIAIKHKDFQKAKDILGEKCAKYLDDPAKAKALSQALKIAINSVYGLTAASFDNPFRDIRNIDNIVAKRGALFMINLKHEVEKRGYTVIHIKTDSIKIANPTEDIISFVMKYGKLYGYSFEIEHVFEKLCLVNNAVYVAKLAKDDPEDPGKWSATGTQFQVPYVFKTLFSHEPIVFDDLCETKSVKTALYLDMNESLPDVSDIEKKHDRLLKKISDAAKENIDMPSEREECEKLSAEIESGHHYIFIGKVGRFCPMKPGTGGGLLVSERDGKYNAVTGTKGYRWLESEMVKVLDKEDEIDESYYISLVDAAVASISEFGDYEWFVGDDEPLPFDEPFEMKGE